MHKGQPGSLPPKKFKRVSSTGKVIASIFFQGVIMVDYLVGGLTINGAYYSEELRRLHQKIVRKRRGKLTRGVLLFQLLTRNKLPWLLRLNGASKSFLIPRIL